MTKMKLAQKPIISKQNINSIDALLPLRKARAEILLTSIRNSKCFELTTNRYWAIKEICGLTRGNIDRAIDDLAIAGLVTLKPGIDGVLVELVNKEVSSNE